MADSRYRIVVEAHIRQKLMPNRFGQKFSAASVALRDGGRFNCDAVSEDATIIACICTNAGKTISNKTATPKLMKIRSDILHMLRAEATRRLVILTDAHMYALCMKQAKAGRMPTEIEFVLAEVPESFITRLGQDHKIAADEVTPIRIIPSQPPPA